MVKIRTLQLKNYCGYRDITFDFSDTDGGIKPISCFFGPNGCGKSTGLDAISMLSATYRLTGRRVDLVLRKCTYHPDYDPTVAGFINSPEPMELIGVFATENGDKKVVITSEGVQLDELPPKAYPRDNSYYIDADNANTMYKFQLCKAEGEKFIDIANVFYGYPCELEGLTADLGNNDEEYYTDFVIQKSNGTRVHYKRMSDGEKKIAQLVAGLCDPSWMNNIDIILVDNIELHVYKNRHGKMINKLLSSFPTKQFVATTHSAILTGVDDNELGIHIKPFLDQKYLYDIEKYRIEESERIAARIVV